jgi:hypothetical protein
MNGCVIRVALTLVSPKFCTTGDNYETQVLFLVIGGQFISSAMAFNFGYEFRKGWYHNYVFVVFAALYCFMHLYIILVPGKLSCVWRVNCVNENTSRPITSDEPFPIQNPFNTTIMPYNFRVQILLLVIFNAIAIAGYEYLVVNGIRRRRSCKPNQPKYTDDNELAHEPKFALMPPDGHHTADV